MFVYLLSLALLCSPLIAQTQASTGSSGNVKEEWSAGYSFALVVRSKLLTVEGDWKQSEALRAYASAHPGSYIVFSNGGPLMLLQEPSEIEKAAKLYIPVEMLGKQQAPLEAKQGLLGRQQALLGRQMKEATGTDEMRRIGAEQGRVGAEQGALGREQGRIGQEQGVAGRSFYNHVQMALGPCLAQRVCVPVQASRTQ